MEKYQILKDLVGFNTIKDKENHQIINYLEGYLKERGFKTEYKDKSLIMSIGKNPKIGFLGHTDTVEYIDGWKTNPFELTKKDNKLYGLGVCDMKSGIAAILDAINNIDLKNIEDGIKLYFTDDEEIGFGGVNTVVKLKKEFPKVMIFGEPTDNEVLIGSKGLLEYKIKFIGKKVHSSTPEKGISANLNAVRFLYELDEFYNKNIKVDEDENFEIPYTTMNVGIINGGSAVNSIPASCDITLDFRITKNEHIEIIKDKINELGKKYNCEISIFEEIKSFINETNLVSQIKTANFFTEASIIDTKTKLILGTGPVTAHEINEYITEESYDKLVNQYTDIIKKFI